MKLQRRSGRSRTPRSSEPLRRAALVGVALVLGLPGMAAVAQTAPGAAGLPDVPTTRVLAIGHLGAQTNPAELRTVMSGEVGDTVRLYLSGKVAEWYVRKDKPGVVFVLDVRDVAEARTLLAALPLGRAGLMDFDLVPLGPLAPLGLLLPKP